MFSSTKCVEILRQKWPKALWRDEVCGELQNSENENSTNSGFNQKLIQTNHSNRSLRMHAGKNIRSQNANPKKHPSKNREMDPNPGQPELLNANQLSGNSARRCAGFFVYQNIPFTMLCVQISFFQL
jgi:hypothetical protein